MAQVVPPPTWQAQPFPTLVMLLSGRVVPHRMQVCVAAVAAGVVSFMASMIVGG